jgi:hypothetical protein
MTQQETLLNLIYKSGAVSIWDNRKGPVFWYAAGVPGPFYCNTEKLIGSDAAATLLDNMNKALAAGGTATDKQARIKSLVMAEYAVNDDFKTLVRFLVEKAKSGFDVEPDFISGGERRDWIFSFPVAQEMGLQHIAMFKNGDISFDPDGHPVIQGKNILHVSDLVNNAASFFDLWIPILERHGAKPYGSLSLVNRGRKGMDKLEDAGLQAVSLISIDSDFFNQSVQSNLIGTSQFDEIELYYASQREWAEKYIVTNADIFQAELLEEKSRKRMESFFANDPWDLKSLGSFFEETAKKLGIAK